MLLNETGQPVLPGICHISRQFSKRPWNPDRRLRPDSPVSRARGPTCSVRAFCHANATGDQRTRHPLGGVGVVISAWGAARFRPPRPGCRPPRYRPVGPRPRLRWRVSSVTGSPYARAEVRLRVAGAASAGRACHANAHQADAPRMMAQAVDDPDRDIRRLETNRFVRERNVTLGISREVDRPRQIALFV